MCKREMNPGDYYEFATMKKPARLSFGAWDFIAVLSLISVFWVGFHNVDLAVNTLINNPENFWAATDCALLWCGPYPKIYMVGLLSMASAFFGMLGLFLVKAVNPKD